MLSGVVICQSAGEYITEAFGGPEVCTPIYAGLVLIWVSLSYVKNNAVLTGEINRDAALQYS